MRALGIFYECRYMFVGKRAGWLSGWLVGYLVSWITLLVQVKPLAQFGAIRSLTLCLCRKCRCLCRDLQLCLHSLCI